MADPNDTDGARVVEGYTIDYRLGSRNRIAPESGELTYDADKLTLDQLDYVEENLGETLIYDGGNALKIAQALGLPEHIKGNPLGCRCPEAHLVGATKPVGSHVEADYMCDSGYHNYVYFELIGFENKGETQIKVDIHGNLIEDKGTQTKELGGEF